MDWCNTTVRSTRLNVFVCPTDPMNDPSNNFFQPSDIALFTGRESRILSIKPREFRFTTGHAAITERFRVTPTPTTRSVELKTLVLRRRPRAMSA